MLGNNWEVEGGHVLPGEGGGVRVDALGEKLSIFKGYTLCTFSQSNVLRGGHFFCEMFLPSKGSGGSSGSP